MLFEYLDFREVDREEQIRRCDSSARKALALFGITNYKIQAVQNFLGENKWRVDCDSGPYLLIMSYPVKLWDFVPSVAYLESQLLWMLYLEEEVGVTLQTPQRNEEGELVSTVRLLDGDLQCALLKWVEGEAVSMTSLKDAENIGKLSGRIHEGTQRWKPGREIVRRQWNLKAMEESSERLKRLFSLGRIEPNRFSIIEGCMNKVLQMWQGADGLKCSITHQDYHPGNCLKQERDYRPIDFEGSGVCPQLWDLALTLGYWRRKNLFGNTEKCLNGYTSIIPLQSRHIELLEAFVVGSIVCKAWAKLEDDPSLSFKQFDRYNQSMFAPFLSGKPFLTG